MAVEVKDLIKILDDPMVVVPQDKADAIIVLLGKQDQLDAARIIWDTGLWNACHPRKGSTANMRILDVVFHYYTDEE